MNDNSWNYLINPETEILGLKNDTADMKGWLNDIINRVNAIEDNGEAIKTLFVINQKIGYVKGQNKTYYYPQKLYEKLQITVNILLRNRINPEKQESRSV